MLLVFVLALVLVLVLAAAAERLPAIDACLERKRGGMELEHQINATFKTVHQYIYSIMRACTSH